MLLAGGTSNILSFDTGSAGSIRAQVHYLVTDQSSPPVVQGNQSGGTLFAAVTTATNTPLKAGIASRIVRVTRVVLFNDSATVTNRITVKLTDGTNTPPELAWYLAPGERLEYDGQKWLHYDSNGAIILPSTKLDAKLVVTSDLTFATAATFADVTGLTVPLKSGKRYAFEAHLYHISNATTTGAQFGVNIGAAPTTLQIAAIDTILASATASTHASGSATARDTAAIVETTGAAAVVLGILSGYIVPSADGTFAIRATSEVTVASGLIVKAGSWLRIWETDN